ncbi:riboflavin synthase [Patescibacteria group bacterium]|nr:riboflavin synthase [Patescibacteria group bacterium]
MFTGIVEKTGKIQNIKKDGGKIYFTLEVKYFLSDIKIGGSISCDGVCLTVVKKTKDSFTVELMPETLRLTKFADSQVGDLINLEKSLKIGERIDGHFVMGHVDGVGIVSKIEREGEYINLIIKVPKKIIKYLAYKGSVSINGVSLTIAGNGPAPFNCGTEHGIKSKEIKKCGASKDWLKVCLITHTLEITDLSVLKTGDKVNIEVDMIARYLERLLSSK